MAKHDRARQEKEHRNALYADRYRQRICQDCNHRSSLPGRCKICGSDKRKLRRHH